jgi:lipoic acid synthetase
VTAGDPAGRVDPREPEHTAEALVRLGLGYVVVTMVTRDDLPDGGASQLARTVRSIRSRSSEISIELLVSDLGGRECDLDTVLDARPDVIGHNVEVTRSMTGKIRDARCSFDRSLGVLRYARHRGGARCVKSSIMGGVGETDAEVAATLAELREAGTDVVTIGQYLRPSPRHWPVARYVSPDQFLRYEQMGRELGLPLVVAGPLVRSSYHAAEAFVRSCAPESARGPARTE